MSVFYQGLKNENGLSVKFGEVYEYLFGFNLGRYLDVEWDFTKKIKMAA